MQPWTFVAVADAELKRRLRAAAELERPPNEHAMLVMPVGYPADGAMVPDLTPKPLAEIAAWK